MIVVTSIIVASVVKIICSVGTDLLFSKYVVHKRATFQGYVFSEVSSLSPSLANKGHIKFGSNQILVLSTSKAST